MTMTLLATVLGASTTIGITDTVNQIGFPGIWWLIFGAVGLVLQSLIISERVRGIDADTLPDLAGRIVGKPAEVLLALIIVISWVGVIAGQFVALGSIIAFATGINSRLLVAIVSIIVIPVDKVNVDAGSVPLWHCCSQPSKALVIFFRFVYHNHRSLSQEKQSS